MLVTIDMVTFAQRKRLVDLCCIVISTKRELYNVEELNGALPKELFSICFLGHIGSNNTIDKELVDYTAYSTIVSDISLLF